MRGLPLVGLFFAGVFLAAQAQDQAKPEQKARPRISAPVPINLPEAEMPDEAVRTKQAGGCVIGMVVDAAGSPQDVRVVGCTDPMFAKNSLDAAKQYKFKPARRDDGTAVPVTITVEIKFGFRGNLPDLLQYRGPVRYGISSPPGMRSADPDADGIYPLSKQLEVPQLVKFVNKGFEERPRLDRNDIGCHVLMVIDAQGKPSDASVVDCDDANLQRPAVESLLKSKYKPAKLNGKAVPVRLVIHIYYAGFGVHELPDSGSPRN